MLEERNCFEDPGTGERIILKKAGCDSCGNFIYMAHDREQQWVFVSILTNFGVTQKREDFLSSTVSISCSRILTP
jgi:hypothetical protein